MVAVRTRRAATVPTTEDFRDDTRTHAELDDMFHAATHNRKHDIDAGGTRNAKRARCGIT